MYVTICHICGVLLFSYFYSAPDVGDGVGPIVIDQFLSLFLCQQDYEKTAGPICVKFSGKVWSDDGTT